MPADTLAEVEVGGGASGRSKLKKSTFWMASSLESGFGEAMSLFFRRHRQLTYAGRLDSFPDSRTAKSLHDGGSAQIVSSSEMN
ncbi:hypothetical protein [Plantibacter sp. MPB07]|uniref:hypothetical protein n=1 Tax=Plantibacter sp. MPB07 TaxID=3388853 RepID=UPI00398768FA